MFGVSLYELLVIVIVFIVLFKPKDLPNMLYNLGKMVSSIKNFIKNLEQEIEGSSNLGNLNDYLIVTKDQEKSNQNPINNNESTRKTKRSSNISNSIKIKSKVSVNHKSALPVVINDVSEKH